MRIIQPNMRGKIATLAGCLQSFIALELISSSPTLYIHTPVIKNPTILKSRAGEYAPILNDPNLEQLTLIEVLRLLADRGTEIRIRYRDEISSLVSNGLVHPHIQIQQHDSIYPPGWITENYAISGILYFEANKVDFSEDKVSIITTENDLERLFLEAENTW